MKRLCVGCLLVAAMLWHIGYANATSVLSSEDMALVQGGGVERCKWTTCPPSINPCACVHRPQDPPGFYYCDSANPSIACNDKRIQPKTGEGTFNICDYFGVGYLCPDNITQIECGEERDCDCDTERHACTWNLTLGPTLVWQCP